jgi:ribose transport system ATP-binding protein
LSAIHLGIATVHQELSLCGNLSVAENLQLGSLPHRFAGLVDRARLREDAIASLEVLGVSLASETVVDEVPILGRQLVEIAKALRRQPQVLILDEPTSALKESERQALFAVVERVRAHAAVILISHRLDEVLAHCDRVIVLRDGSLVREGPVGEADVHRLVQDMVSKDIGEFFPKSNEVMTEGPPVLELDHLSGRIGGVEVHEVSLAVRPGEIVGLAGLSGSGAQEVIQLLGGVQRPKGHVRVLGRAVQVGSPADALRHGICYVPNDRKVEGLAMELSTVDNGVLSVLRQLGGTFHVLSHRQAVRSLADQLSEVVFRGDPEGPVGELSGGNQQKVIFVKMTHRRAAPRVLALNDFTRGIDVGAKRELYDVIMRSANEGLGVLLASTDLEELVQLSDRVLVFREGRIVREMERGAGMRGVQEEMEGEGAVATAGARLGGQERRPA